MGVSFLEGTLFGLEQTEMTGTQPFFGVRSGQARTRAIGP